MDALCNTDTEKMLSSYKKCNATNNVHHSANILNGP